MNAVRAELEALKAKLEQPHAITNNAFSNAASGYQYVLPRRDRQCKTWRDNKRHCTPPCMAKRETSME